MRTETIRVPRTVAAWVAIRRHRTDKLVRLLVADEMEVRSVAEDEAPLVARIRDGIGTLGDPEYRFHEGRYWRAVVHAGDRVDLDWLSRRADHASESCLPKEFDRVDPGFADRKKQEFHDSMRASDRDVLRWEAASSSGPDLDPDALLLVGGAMHVACGEPVACVGYGSSFAESDPFVSEYRSVSMPMDLPSRPALADAAVSHDEDALDRFGSVETFGGHVFSDFATLNMPTVWHGLLRVVDGIDASDVERTAAPLEAAVRCLRDCRRAIDGSIPAIDALALLPAAVEALRPLVEKEWDIAHVDALVEIAVRAGILDAPGSDREDAAVYSMEF